MFCKHRQLTLVFIRLLHIYLSHWLPIDITSTSYDATILHILIHKYDAGHGLVADHTYAVLVVRRVRGQKFVLLRNPFGPDRPWTGPWSEGSEEIEQDQGTAVSLEFALADIFSQEDAEHAFWMTFEDFCSRVNQLFYFRSDYEAVKENSVLRNAVARKKISLD